ncbi:MULTISPECIES: hypothetical protein [Chromohalobacter]|uniref:hypothetical protein n=1 Tax=Chromohalobacter TaxID=42054 RepID=UPI000D717CEA|nr:hypothetical protein [Chromohalobacter salexigens]PWW33595.1 hypothetical protein DFO74_1248 [Chromohalobacter salexigens]
MAGDVQRLQYLEAMGLGAWTSRYRLPNARPTPQCEWDMPAQPDTTPNHGARLQALLDDVAAPAAPSTSPAREPAPAPEKGPADKPAGSRARALLLGEAASETPSEAAPAAPASETTGQAPREALRYAVQVAALDGRWLLLLPEAQAPDPRMRQLLVNLLRTAGIEAATEPAFQSFQWPLVDNAPVAAPLDEARDGLRAYLNGQARRGWRPERLMVFGEDETLTTVLAVDEAHSETLDLPCWRLPSLATLMTSADAKRALWPRLVAWRNAWNGSGDAS